MVIWNAAVLLQSFFEKKMSDAGVCVVVETMNTKTYLYFSCRETHNTASIIELRSTRAIITEQFYYFK